MQKLRLYLELNDSELSELSRMSHLLREEPRKPWNVRERKEHARFAGEQLILKAIRAKLGAT